MDQFQFKPKSNVAEVKLVDGRTVLLPITSPDKPDIPPQLKDNWQRITNHLAKMLQLSACLIMRIRKKEIEVFVASEAEETPYRQAERERLGQGLYCETVIGTKEMLHVPDALVENSVWKNNPDVDLNMIMYLGLPLIWPDGESFGTICLLNNMKHHCSREQIESLELLRSILEGDLYNLVKLDELEKLVQEKKVQLMEANHRICNHLNMLSSILQVKAISGDGLTIDDLLNRITCIAELHSHISKANGHDSGPYDLIKTIADAIIKATARRPIGLTIDVSPNEMTVSNKILSNIGLLVSELITNTLKHAFETTAYPLISISLSERDQETLSMTYIDNGSGFSTNESTEDTSSLGMQLIYDIPKQLGGSVLVRGDKGAFFNFTFKKYQ